MSCGCKKKKTPPVEQPNTTVNTTDNNVKINETTNTRPIEANDVDNNTLITKITNRLKEITN